LKTVLRIFILLLVSGVRVGAAQTPAEHPLLTLFGSVPPSAALETGGLLRYIDYDVIFSANGETPLDATMSVTERAAISARSVAR